MDNIFNKDLLNIRNNGNRYEKPIFVNNGNDKINYVHWNITRRCNYDCSYCSTREKRLKGDISIDPDPYLFLEKFSKYLSGSWVFHLSGPGEPFMAPRFLDIVKELIKMGHWVGILTNFSASEEKIMEFCEICGDKLFEFGASLHMENVNPAKFLKKAILFKKIIGDKFFVCSVGRKGKLTKLDKIGRSFRKNGISFGLQLERDRSKSDPEDFFIRYSKKEQGIIKKPVNFLIKKGSLNLNGKLCFTGKRYFCLNGDGEACRCWPAMKAKNRYGDQSGYLGNLLEDTFKLRNKPDFCPYDCCHCPDPIRLGMITNLNK